MQLFANVSVTLISIYRDWFSEQAAVGLGSAVGCACRLNIKNTWWWQWQFRSFGKALHFGMCDWSEVLHWVYLSWKLKLRTEIGLRCIGQAGICYSRCRVGSFSDFCFVKKFVMNFNLVVFRCVQSSYKSLHWDRLEIIILQIVS
jgi:hypothetical protein